MFADDVAACLEGRNKELPEVAEQVLKTMRMVVEGKGWNLSITGGGKEQGHCVQLLGEEVSGMQQKRKCEPCKQRGHVRSGSGNVDEGVGGGSAT